MIGKLRTFCLFAGLVILVSGCASSAELRQKRVEANLDTYHSLSAEDRALVDQGRLREDMSKPAVFLAWGRPDSIRQGSRQGVPYETWHYTAHLAHSRTNLSLGYGYGGPPYYPYYGRYYGYPYIGFYPSVATTYVPVNVGRVEFLNDKVVSWEVKAR